MLIASDQTGKRMFRQDEYANLHHWQETSKNNQSHLTKFLTSINNIEISREICR